jgi:cellulose synthase/poly-beta-1,6-N-acetylglucosamine synthase-like glycosyltransferase
LGRCLESLKAGERLPDEILVVDQSTESATSDVVAGWRERMMGLPITYVRHDARGLGAAQNVAFGRAGHPVIAVLDDDCVAHRSWLRVIASRLDERPDLDAVTGRVLPLDPVGARTFPVSSRVSEVRREFAGQAVPWEVGSGNNFAARGEALTRSGGCDERLGPGSPAQGGVDMDLFHRLLRTGSRILYEPEAIVYHERQTREERKARRPMYGRGMGTAIALWHRAGDRSSAFVLREWTRLRIRQMRLAAMRGDWTDVGDEITMLLSTVQGLSHGWKLGAGQR